MAKVLKNAELSTKAARERLKAQAEPHWRNLDGGDGVHLGYRKKGKHYGVWLVRWRVHPGYRREELGAADDVLTEGTLDFNKACQEARKVVEAKRREERAAAEGAIPTVRSAVQSYIAMRDERETRRRGRPTRSDAHRLDRYVAELADVPLHRLEADDLAAWRAELPEGTVESSKQRLANDLRAALNAACTDKLLKANPMLLAVIKRGLAANGNGYDEDEPASVDDNQILTDAQVGKLIGAAQELDAEQGWGGDLYRLVVVLAATGTRYSQAARLRVSDYQRDAKRLMVPTSRKGKNRKAGSTPVPIEKGVLDALLPAVTGRPGKAWLLERWGHKRARGGITWKRDGRRQWRSKEITRPWQVIRERAELPEVIAYALRHSSIVRSIRQGLPIQLVAKLHDTSTVIIERHYAKWIASGLEELAARAVVSLLPKEEGSKVVTLR